MQLDVDRYSLQPVHVWLYEGIKGRSARLKGVLPSAGEGTDSGQVIQGCVHDGRAHRRDGLRRQQPGHQWEGRECPHAEKEKKKKKKKIFTPVPANSGLIRHPTESLCDTGSSELLRYQQVVMFQCIAAVHLGTTLCEDDSRLHAFQLGLTAQESNFMRLAAEGGDHWWRCLCLRGHALGRVERRIQRHTAHPREVQVRLLSMRIRPLPSLHLKKLEPWVYTSKKESWFFLRAVTR